MATEPTPTDALAPCPFCGGDARNDAHADDCYFVLHRKLNAQPEADLSMHLEVLAAWNRRTQPAPAASVLEDAAKLCETMHEEDRPGDYAYAIRKLKEDVQ